MGEHHVKMKLLEKGIYHITDVSFREVSNNPQKEKVLPRSPQMPSLLVPLMDSHQIQNSSFPRRKVVDSYVIIDSQ